MSYLALALAAEARRLAGRGAGIRPNTHPLASTLASAEAKARRNEKRVGAAGHPSITPADIRPTMPVLALRMPGVEGNIWFVPDESHALGLTRQGVGRGHIWTAGELTNLFAADDRPWDLDLTLARAKIALDADIVEVHLG